MKVAVIQYAPVFKEVEQNLQTALRLVEEAARNGAQLIVLPELCTSGYSFMSEEDARPYAETLDGKGPIMGLFQRMTALTQTAIAWGMPSKEDQVLHNSQILMLPNGTWESYSKLNSWGQDYLWSTPGTKSPPIITYRGKKVGLLICRDIRDKSSDFKTFYEKGDADIVAFSSNFGDGAFPATSWIEFATGNKVWLAISNRYGREANNNFGEGGVCIIEPGGKVHCEGLRWSSPCVVYADVP